MSRSSLTGRRICAPTPSVPSCSGETPHERARPHHRSAGARPGGAVAGAAPRRARARRADAPCRAGRALRARPLRLPVPVRALALVQAEGGRRVRQLRPLLSDPFLYGTIGTTLLL